MPTKERAWKARKNRQGCHQGKDCGHRSARGAHLPQCERSAAAAVREERVHSHARGARPKPCERTMLSSAPRERCECPLRGECGKQGKTAKVVIEERTKDCSHCSTREHIYRSVRGAQLPQCERSVSTAM